MSNTDFDPTEVAPPVDFAARRAQALVAASAEDNPDDAARANDLAGSMGINPGVAYENRENLETQYKARLAGDIVKGNSYLQDYVNSHPLAAKVSNDDYGQLDAVSQAVDKFGPETAAQLGYVPDDGNSVLKAGVKGFLENADFGGLDEEHQKLASMLASNPVFANIFVRQATLAGADVLEGANRLAGGLIGGASAAVGELAKQAGGNEAWSNRLTRDLITMAQVGLSGQAGLHGPVAPEVHAMINEAANAARTVSPYVLAGKEPPVGVHPVLDEFKVEQAKLDADNLAEVLKESVKSATRERSPDMFAKYIGGITQGEIGINADAVRALYGEKPPVDGEGPLGFVSGLADKLATAEATGGDVQVPIADWLARVEPDVAKELADHIRARPEGMTVEEGKNPPPIEAYHGSPYEFDAFSSDKIGTGEGAQSYGHGLYFAEAPEVAQDYQSRLGLAQLNLHDAPYIDRAVKAGKSDEEIIQGLADRGNPYGKGELSAYRNQSKGATYKVHIHANKDDFLDYDAPLHPADPRLKAAYDKAGMDITGATDVQDAYRQLATRLGSEEAASKALHEAGIPGIKYLDEQSRRGSAQIKQQETALANMSREGSRSTPEDLERIQSSLALSKERFANPTSNFVLFDPSLVEITHRNGEAVRTVRQAAGLEPSLVKSVEEGAKPTPTSTEPAEREAFAKAAAIGMTKDQYTRYQALIEKRATQDAEAASTRAMADQRRAQTAEWKANRAELRPQVKAEIEARPEVELDALLRGGKVKLNPEGLTDDQVALLPKDYISANGIHPDDLAGLFGDHPRGLVDKLIALGQSRDAAGMKPEAHLRRLVEAETDRQMEAKYGSLDRNILEEAKDQVLSETQEDLLHEETLARAAEAGLQFSIEKESYKAALKDFFDRQLVKDVGSDKALAESGRAGRAAEMALLKGDYAEAFRQKQRQYNAVVIANFARKFEKTQAAFEKIAKRFSSREVAGVTPEYTNWVQDILTRVGQTVKRNDLADAISREQQTTLADFVEHKELHDMREVPVAEFLMDPAFRKTADALTTAEFSAVHDSIKALAKNGRDEMKIIKAGEEFDLDATKKQMIAQLAEFKEKHYDASGGRPLGKLPAAVARPLRTYLVSHLQLESIFNRWDRGDPRGVFTQFVARELATAANSEAALEREFATKLRAVADSANLKERVPNELFKDPLGGSSIAMTRKNLRAIMLNVGNKSNFDKLARGYAGALAKGEEGKAQLAAYQAQVMDWIHQNATKEDWDHTQGIWDIFKGIKKQSDTMYRSLTGGVEPENIPTQPIVTPHGAYDGGYYPVIYHPVWEGASKKLMGGDPLEQQNYNRATTPAGYTKARTGYAAPLSLDLDMMPVRMRQMIHDIAFRPSVIQAGKIFYDKDVRAAITKHYGTEYTKMLVPYLRDVANAANYRNDAQQVFTRLSEHVRQNIISTLIGLNPGTVLKHGPTAAINSMTEVGMLPFLKAMKGLMSINEQTGESNWAFAMKTSEELQRRQRFYRETLGGATEELQGESSMRDHIIALGAHPVAMSDLLSATPTWVAKYTSEMADHGVHGDAVFAADRAVRRAHGSSVITNRPQVMRTGPMGSWLASLYGFFNHIMNRQYEMAWKAGDTLDLVKQGEYAKAMAEVPKLSGMLFSYVIAPAVIEELVTPMANEQKESWGKKAAKTLAYSVSASWIGIRDIVSAMVNGRDPSIGLLSTAYKTITDAGRDLEKDRPLSKQHAGALIQHSATALGAATGWMNAQVGKTGRFIYDYANGLERPKGPWGWMVGARYGTLKNHTPTFEQYMRGR